MSFICDKVRSFKRDDNRSLYKDYVIYKDIRTASRGSFLKPFNKLAARVLSGPKPDKTLTAIHLLNYTLRTFITVPVIFFGVHFKKMD